MTVKKLTQDQKNAIITIYNSKTKTIKDMAKHLGVSPRTVGRVIVEAGLATPVPRLKGEAYLALKVLGDWGLVAQDLQPILEAMEDNGLLILSNGKIMGVKMPEPNNNQVRDLMADLPEADYNKLLAEIIHLREARKHNSSVANAMLQLQNKADKNAS